MKLKKSIIINLLTIIILSGCQDNLELDKTIDQAEYSENKKEVSPILSEKFYKLTTFQSSNKTPPFISNDNKRLNIKKIKERRISREQSTEFNEIDTIKTEQMPTPFLPPSGKNQVDLFFNNAFFYILEMQEMLRTSLDTYNKFTINFNLHTLSHPALLHGSESIGKLMRLRHEIRQQITFLKNEIKKYNQEINNFFPNTNRSHKMSGYYSSDNTHLPYSQSEFSIEDIHNASYSYAEKLVTKDFLKSQNPKIKIRPPEVGTRRGTVFVSAGQPNVLRGIFGNNFGAFSLGIAVGMTIEWAITGKIYYYKGYM